MRDQRLMVEQSTGTKPSCWAVCVLQAKQERLRQAKAEAEREIAAYKAEREGAYQKKLAEVGRAAGMQLSSWHAAGG